MDKRQINEEIDDADLATLARTGDDVETFDDGEAV